MTRFQTKSSRLADCAKIVCWRVGDLIPSDYGTHHGRAARFCGERWPINMLQTQPEEWMQAIQTTWPLREEFSLYLCGRIGSNEDKD